MDAVLVIANLGCLAAAVWGALTLWRSSQDSAAPASFAATLATAQAAPREENAVADADPIPLAGAPKMPAPDRQGDEQLVSSLGVAERLAILRNMLQGRTVAEAATATAVTPASVQAMYRLHGRDGR